MKPFTVVIVMIVTVLAAACGPSGGHVSGSVSGSPTASTGRAAIWNIVALGDSDATGSGDPTGIGWVGRYARLLQRKLGLRVHVTNLAVDGTTSDQLRYQLRSVPAIRRDVATAQIVLIGIGGADLNTGDANLQAGKCRGTACYAPVLHHFGRNFGAIVAQVSALRGGSPTVIRAITLANGFPGAGSVYPAFATEKLSLYQSVAEKQIICRAMMKHGGRCVDVLRAFNGPAGSQNAYMSGLMNKQDCCYPSAKGQQLIAELLFRTGLAPIQS